MRSRILFAVCCISVVLGQPSFTATSITTSADGARDVYAVDLDSDGDMDMISGSSIDNTIAWYQNNGSQSFSKKVISTAAIAVMVFTVPTADTAHSLPQPFTLW